MTALACTGEVVDRSAFADRLAAETDFDPEQSRCVAEKVFANFDADVVRALHEEGVSPLRNSLPAQLYVEFLVACVLDESS